MQDSQDFDQTSNSTVVKLLEVDSELAVIEAQLLSQLESIQEKRRSLQTVINLFTKADTLATAPIEEPAQKLSAETDGEPEPVGSDSTPPSLETPRATATASLENEAARDTSSNRAKKTDSSPTSRNKTTQFKHAAKVAPKASGWQQYVREEYSNTSLSEAVSLVLQHQADQVFEIPAVVNTIFVDEIPREVESKVRRQVTNILSDGARKNKWYRGQLGQYSMSRAAAQANSVWQL